MTVPVTIWQPEIARAFGRQGHSSVQPTATQW
jgi:hypothetical protein